MMHAVVVVVIVVVGVVVVPRPCRFEASAHGFPVIVLSFTTACLPKLKAILDDDSGPAMRHQTESK